MYLERGLDRNAATTPWLEDVPQDAATAHFDVTVPVGGGKDYTHFSRDVKT